MKQVTIDPQLKAKIPGYAVAVLSFEIDGAKPSGPEVQEEMTLLENATKDAYTLETLLQEPRIKAARDGYKALGKDPSRYRPSVEALLRRLIKGNGLYQVNDLVDIGNILSVKTRRGIAVLDEEKIQGDILIRIGKDEPYEGIGRGNLNVENIPVYVDDIGPFGSLTSDTNRTRITENTRQVLIFLTSLQGEADLHEDARLVIDHYTRYANAGNFAFEIAD